MDSDHESKEEEDRHKLCRMKVPIQIYKYLDTVADVEFNEEDGAHIEESSATELDSHANMSAVGRHA